MEGAGDDDSREMRGPKHTTTLSCFHHLKGYVRFWFQSQSRQDSKKPSEILFQCPSRKHLTPSSPSSRLVSSRSKNIPNCPFSVPECVSESRFLLLQMNRPGASSCKGPIRSNKNRLLNKTGKLFVALFLQFVSYSTIRLDRARRSRLIQDIQQSFTRAQWSGSN
jgi:hypothetical protein